MKHKDSFEGLQLPLLPLFHTVLLPGGFVRVLIPDSWRKSGSLVQHLLQQSGGEVYVAAVPYSLSKPGDEDEVVEEHLDLDKLHHTGTAARVLQLVKRTEASSTPGSQPFLVVAPQAHHELGSVLGAYLVP